MSGVRLGSLFQSGFSMILGLTIAFATEWRLGMVGACFVPFVYVATRYQATILSSQQWRERVYFEETSKERIKWMDVIQL